MYKYLVFLKCSFQYFLTLQFDLYCMSRRYHPLQHTQRTHRHILGIYFMDITEHNLVSIKVSSL